MQLQCLNTSTRHSRRAKSNRVVASALKSGGVGVKERTVLPSACISHLGHIHTCSRDDGELQIGLGIQSLLPSQHIVREYMPCDL